VIWGWGAAVLFNAGALDAVTQTLCWCVIFFFASAGASAAYLTVSEIFPVEIRARAIAVFFAIAQSFGAFGPWFYGQLIGNGQDHFRLFIGYLIGAAVMLGAGWSTPSSASTLSAGRSKRSPARWAPPRTKRSR
jgi:MFS family permease